LLLAEQDVSRLFVGGSLLRAFDFIFHYGQPTLDRWARFDAVVPTLQMKKIFQILSLPMMGSQLWIGSHIGDRILGGEIWHLTDALIGTA